MRLKSHVTFGELEAKGTTLTAGPTTIVQDWEEQCEEWEHQKQRKRASILGVFAHRRSTVHPLAELGTEESTSWFTKIYKHAWLLLRNRLLQPDGPLYCNWCLLMILPMGHTAVITPYYVGMMKEPGVAIFCLDRIVDLFFIIDIMLNFMLSYRSSVTGAMIFNRKKIATHYLKTGFFLDAICTVPWDFIMSLITHSSTYVLQIIRVLKLLKLVKLLRVLRFTRFLEAFETRFVVDYMILQIMQHIVTIMLATHWVSCILLLFLHVEAIYDESSSWTGTLDLPTDKQTYIAALYFSAYTLTTIGYGDMIPETSAQRVFVVVLMLSGAFLYGYIIGAVSALLGSANERKHLFYRTITKLNRLLEDRHVPADLRWKLRQYFRYKCIFATNMDCMHELLSSMSPGLRREVSAHTCQVLITQVPYFRGCDGAFLMECAMLMQETVFAPMEIAQARGSVVRYLSIIRRGVMVAKGRVLTSGKVLGEESLYKEWPACYSARSMTFTDASQLHRTALLQVLKNYPALLRSFCLRSIQGVFRSGLGL